MPSVQCCGDEKELQRAISKTESGKSCRGHENISMERRKRKKHEDTVDTSLYLKKHQILSYFFDKRNKGAETGGLLIDDDSQDPVGDDAKGLLDIDGLSAAKESDIVSKQFMLQKILLKIAGIQSRVHRLQERLSKACSKQAKLASFMDHAEEVNVAEKRQRIQKRAYSPTNDRYAKPQKKKKLNILLEQEDRLALSVKPTLSERATDSVKEEPQWNSEENAAERGQAHKNTITADLLLGVESSLPNGHLGDLCKENADDILIDNRGAEEEYQPFESVKHPLEKPPVLTKDVAKAAPSKAGNTSEPAVAEKIPVLPVKQEQTPEKWPALTLVYTGKKWRRQPRPEDTGSAAASNNHIKEASSETAAAKQKGQTTAQAENENGGSKKQKTMDTRSSSKKLNFVNSSSAAKTPKTGNSSSAAKTPKTGNSSSAAKTPKTGNLSAAKMSKTGSLSSDGNKRAAGNSSASGKKPRTGNSSSDGKKHAAGNTSAPAPRKEMGGNIPPANMRIEKAILVEVNTRKSQRPRKPKVY
ncbi:unnamed protein product [Alopecurus aequalis]